MEFSIGDSVFVNYEDGVIEVTIVDIRENEYLIELFGGTYRVGFDEVSKFPIVLEGVAPFRRTSSGAEE